MSAWLSRGSPVRPRSADGWPEPATPARWRIWECARGGEASSRHSYERGASCPPSRTMRKTGMNHARRRTPSAPRRAPRTRSARRRTGPGLSSSPSTYPNGDDPKGRHEEHTVDLFVFSDRDVAFRAPTTAARIQTSFRPRSRCGRTVATAGCRSITSETPRTSASSTAPLTSDQQDPRMARRPRPLTHTSSRSTRALREWGSGE